MKRDNKKALYESIMVAVAKEVRKALNENASENNIDVDSVLNQVKDIISQTCDDFNELSYEIRDWVEDDRSEGNDNYRAGERLEDICLELTNDSHYQYESFVNIINNIKNASSKFEFDDAVDDLIELLDFKIKLIDDAISSARAGGYRTDDLYRILEKIRKIYEQVKELKNFNDFSDNIMDEKLPVISGVTADELAEKFPINKSKNVGYIYKIINSIMNLGYKPISDELYKQYNTGAYVFTKNGNIDDAALVLYDKNRMFENVNIYAYTTNKNQITGETYLLNWDGMHNGKFYNNNNYYNSLKDLDFGEYNDIIKSAKWYAKISYWMNGAGQLSFAA